MEVNVSLEFVSVPDSFENSKVWRALLREWIELLHSYSTPNGEGERDVPYWYGERSLTGLLAAAAWRLKNGWSLEEFSTLRGQEEEARVGWADLWIGIGGESFTVEAKLTWPEGDSESAAERIRERLNEARDQLRAIENAYREGEPFSVCYIVPWPRVRNQGNNMPEAIEQMKEIAQIFQKRVKSFIAHLTIS